MEGGERFFPIVHENLHLSAGQLDHGIKAGNYKQRLLTVFPEQAVVDVSSSIELESTLESDGSRDIARRHSGINLLHSGVQVCDVRVVVLGVVNLHGFGRNGGLQRIVIVGHIGENCRLSSRERTQEGRAALGDRRRDFGGLQVDCSTESGIDKELSSHGGKSILSMGRNGMQSGGGEEGSRFVENASVVGVQACRMSIERKRSSLVHENATLPNISICSCNPQCYEHK